jgi:hypothetical protein
MSTRLLYNLFIIFLVIWLIAWLVLLSSMAVYSLKVSF